MANCRRIAPTVDKFCFTNALSSSVLEHLDSVEVLLQRGEAHAHRVDRQVGGIQVAPALNHRAELPVFHTVQVDTGVDAEVVGIAAFIGDVLADGVKDGFTGFRRGRIG